jgi:hypothetical protein
MKRFLKPLVIFTLLMVVLTSCEKNPAQPVISDIEIGKDNSKKAYIGKDLHIEASIVAEAKIARIVLTIHPEEEDHGHAHVPSSKAPAATTHSISWEVDTTYISKFAGLKNAAFHEHLKVPLYAAEGSYHLHFMVVDMEGNSATFEEEFELEIEEHHMHVVLQ